MKIYILGCGALGSNIAMNLAFDRRDDELVLVDFDKVEPRNYQFGTQQYLREQEGMEKTYALKFNIYKIASNSKVEIRDNKVQEWGFGFVEKNDLIVDCLDNYSARNYVANQCKDSKLTCVHAGFSPSMTFEIAWNENYQVPDDVKTDFDICEAEGARSFIQHVSGIATAVIIEYLKTGKKLDIIGNRFVARKVE